MTRLNPHALPELLLGGEARQLAGVTTAVWLELLETGKLPQPVQVGGRYKWRKTDILDWIESLNSVDLFRC